MEGLALTLAELAVETDCQLVGDPQHTISGVAELDSAGVHDAAYVVDSRYVGGISSSKAGVIFITPQLQRPEGHNYLLSNDPGLAFQKLAKLIASKRRRPLGFTGIHPSAVIHPTATIGNGVQIGPHAVVERDVVIGDGSTISALVYLGPEVTIGQDTLIQPNVTIQDKCQIGNRVFIQSGSVIGGVGFGFRLDEQGHHQRYEHLGNVIIEDDVEIGANTTIDRARLKSTCIGRGTKIDNQVQIAHNCKLGQDNIVVSQVGIAGSSETGRWVVLAGRVCINDHVKICDKTTIAACSAVLRDINTPGTYIGFPAIPLKRHHRILVCFHNLDRIFSDVQKIKRLLDIKSENKVTAGVEK